MIRKGMLDPMTSLDIPRKILKVVQELFGIMSLLGKLLP